ncbi:protein cab-1 [Tetranychus urticae]|uniref:Neural proliferation differentiation and control protein 1 n=1 Tax=Tetranychus urticae TaxID=32264 RepID=T1K6H3_TETUR|nr:protein cab-1 [Tetranychus urticae]
MFNWLYLSIFLIILSNFNVDGRFRRLSSGLSSLSSASSGRWRLMTPNDIIRSYPLSKLDNSKRYYTYSDDEYSTEKRFSNGQFKGPFISQRYQPINPIKFVNHQRLPIYLNHHRYSFLNNPNSYENDSESNNNQPQHYQKDQNTSDGHLRTNDQLKVSSNSTQKTGNEKHENAKSSDEIVPTYTESSNVKSSKLESVQPNLSSFNYQRIAYMKKASVESVDESNSLFSPYRSTNQPHSSKPGSPSFSDLYFVAIVVGSSGAAIFAVIGAGYCFYRFQQHSKSAADVDYPAYGVVGPITKESANSGNISPVGDRKLAQSAQMYHYHHQKQQMIASEKVVASRHTSASDVDSEEENEEGDYTVYECPGLASTGEMEVKNPLFQDDITPVSSPSVVNNSDSKDKK